MEWYSYCVAVILLISSVVSPWLVNRQNNEHQLNIKKLDMYEEAKRKALAEFIECTQNYLLNSDHPAYTVKYYSSLNKLFIYFSGIDLSTFIPLENAIDKENNHRKTILELSKIVHVLSKQIAKE